MSDTNIAVDSKYNRSPVITHTINVLRDQIGFVCVRNPGKTRPTSLQDRAVYGDLALKYSDLTDDENLVEFFREVLDRRDQLDQE